MTKVCNTCHQDKPIEEFSLKNKVKGIRQTKCKSCTKEYGKLHYQQNSKKYKYRAYNNNPQYVKRNRRFIKKYLADHPCTKCGEADIVVLDFHHLENKDNNVSTLVWNGIAIKRIEAEIKKCIILCANCHRREHNRGVLEN